MFYKLDDLNSNYENSIYFVQMFCHTTIKDYL